MSKVVAKMAWGTDEAEGGGGGTCLKTIHSYNQSLDSRSLQSCSLILTGELIFQVSVFDGVLG